MSNRRFGWYKVALVVLVSLLFGGYPYGSSLAQEQGGGVETQSQNNSEGDQDADSILGKMIGLVKEAEGKLIPTLRKLKGKQKKLENVEKDFNLAIKRLDEMAKMGGPDGVLEKSINKLMEFSNKKAAEFAVDEDETLRQLAADYTADSERLQKRKDEMAEVYGSILRKIRFLKEKKRVVIALAERGIFKKAVALVEEGIKALKEANKKLGDVQKDVKEVSDKNRGATE